MTLESANTQDENTSNQAEFPRRIKSFMIRNGRFTNRQQFAIENFWIHYGIDFEANELDFTQIFGNSNDVILEIGYGMGTSLIEMAKNNPNKNYLGIEVHLPGVGNTLLEIHENKFTNVKLICHDGVEVFEKMIPNNSLAGFQLFFPDPWPKIRHHKRRIVNQNFLSMIIPKLKTTGFIHFTTDWSNYAEWMLEHLNLRDELENTALLDFIPRPDSRPLTKFEKFGHKKNHDIFDLYFIKK